MDPALVSLSGSHFERSKLVLLGLATRDSASLTAGNWSRDRELATALLNDTRIYRIAAEERGMNTLAGVMRDLELVLLQTSMSEQPDAASLEQLKRLIRRRDLLTKMDAVTTAGAPSSVWSGVRSLPSECRVPYSQRSPGPAGRKRIDGMAGSSAA